MGGVRRCGKKVVMTRVWQEGFHEKGVARRLS